jgi:spore coat protein CotH
MLRARYDQNTFYPCDVEWRRVKVRNAGCRSRGFGSRNPVKPGLDIEFGHYAAGQRFLGLSSLVLDNLWQDPTMVKERLSMLLFRRLGLPAPRVAHVRLFIGSARHFAGLYGVVEPVDAALLAREFGEGDGHLYEYRWTDAYHFEDLGAELEAYAARFEPRTRQQDSMYALYAPIRDLITAINELPLPDLESILDVRGVIRQVAVESVLADLDGLLGSWGVNNFYLYRSASGAARVIPWDKDTTFSLVDLAPWHNVDTNVLMRRVWADEAFRELYLEALRQTANAAAFLAQEVAFEYAQVAAAALEDPYKPVANEAYVAAVRELVEFIRARPAIVREFLDAPRQ